ncbi:hypothetical protein E4T49_03092 [Aureobasidium sp. EXF-10728]|nr:hypothetical protein E4T49_03092 [Aureobasidium sp. EXF-10728]
MSTTTTATATSTDIELQELQGRLVDAPDISTLSQLLNRKTRQAPTLALTIFIENRKKLGGPVRWPAGAERLSNAGNICFAYALMAVSLVLVVESIRALASDGHELRKFHVEAIIAAAIGFGIKLFLAIYCFIFRKHSSQPEMLWQDNRNDCFEYGFAIFTSAAGAKLKCSLGVLQLCGLGAPANVVQELIFITLRHSKLILKVDSALAYHWGEDLFVEVDIVMSPDCSLREAHDVLQALQDKLETVEGVGDFALARTPQDPVEREWLWVFWVKAIVLESAYPHSEDGTWSGCWEREAPCLLGNLRSSVADPALQELGINYHAVVYALRALQQLLMCDRRARPLC